jgi:hypothetical protein
VSASDDGTIEVHGERYKARAWWDDRDSQNTGWYIEYQNERGDTIDDSVKIWHPPVLEDEDDAEAVTAIAAAYLAKLEGGAS